MNYLHFSALTSENSGIIIITPGTPKPITSKRFIASLNLNLNLASPYAAGAQINILKNTDDALYKSEFKNAVTKCPFFITCV